jgi:hypothetical protein
MNNKKAQGMSINMIVVAAIALLVMVILIAIFSSQMGDFGEQKDNCIAQGGACTPPQTDRRCASGEVRINAECSGTDICCVKLGS